MQGAALGRRYLHRSPRLIQAAVLFVGSFLAQIVSICLCRGENPASIVWFAGAVLLAILLCHKFEGWTASYMGWMVGLWVSAIALPPRFAIALMISPLLATLLASKLIHVIGLKAFVGRIHWSVVISSMAVIVGSLVLGIKVMRIYQDRVLPLLGQNGLYFALSLLLGFVLLVPALFCPVNPLPEERWTLHWRVAIATIGGVAITWLAWRLFGQLSLARPLLLLLPLPALIFVAFHTQVIGINIAIVLFGVVGMQISLDQHGPFLAGDSLITIATVQLWTLGLSFVALFLVIIARRYRAMENSAISNDKYINDLKYRLVHAEEKESARIARDLHDDIGQRLAIAAMRLGELRGKVVGDVLVSVRNLHCYLISLCDDIHRFAQGLHPGAFIRMGLSFELEELCILHRNRGISEIFLHIHQDIDSISGDVGICLYRVAQEALSNAIRHAHASRIDVTVTLDKNDILMKIVDNGVGFVVADKRKKRGGGLGLLSMDERVRLAGGDLHLTSEPGKGVVLCIRIPLHCRKVVCQKE